MGNSSSKSNKKTSKSNKKSNDRRSSRRASESNINSNRRFRFRHQSSRSSNDLGTYETDTAMTYNPFISDNYKNDDAKTVRDSKDWFAPDNETVKGLFLLVHIVCFLSFAIFCLLFLYLLCLIINHQRIPTPITN